MPQKRTLTLKRETLWTDAPYNTILNVGIAELEDKICRGNAPVLTPESGGATTGGLPLQTFIQQRPLDIPAPINIQPGWYMLEKQHLLFCGDTASPKFVERIPQAAIAIAITGDDWDRDWLIERAKTVIVFSESNLKEQMLSSLLSMFSTPGEAVIFPCLPELTMLAIAHKLERNMVLLNTGMNSRFPNCYKPSMVSFVTSSEKLIHTVNQQRQKYFCRRSEPREMQTSDRAFATLG